MLFMAFNGLGIYGMPFSCTLLDRDGNVRFRGWYSTRDIELVEWVQAKVVPHLGGTKYEYVYDFYSALGHAWEDARQSLPGSSSGEIPSVHHTGAPIVWNTFREMMSRQVISPFSGPYPLLTTASLLQAKGYPPLSEAGYAKEKGILPSDYRQYSDLHAANLTRLVWLDLTK